MNIMQAETWTSTIDPTGWLLMEKYDGVRVRWTGTKMLTRTGAEILAPEWFTKDLPPFELDAELWAGYQNFETVRQVVQSNNSRDSRWDGLFFIIFDSPKALYGVELRLLQAWQYFLLRPVPHVIVVPTLFCRDKEHLQEVLRAVIHKRGEGLVIADPDAPYTPGRVKTLLKVKPYEDAEAVVFAHLPGDTLGSIKSLQMRTPEGIHFKLSIGLTAKMKSEPPPIGTVITYVYEGFTANGLPKFPGFLRIREEG